MKKGFFFSLDSILALILFGVVLAGIYSFFLVTHSIDQQFYLSEDILNRFSTVNVGELDLTKYPEIQKMVAEETIKDMEVTLIEQIVIFRENEGEESPSANLFIRDLTDSLIPAQYGFAVDVNGELFTRSKEVTTLISRERLVFGEV
ncbi:hypothetical protein J4426_03415 [Candidatus Woesearchaeota archaeon]|nr:hypothetical protein [Candidatus Woesearchaeota archaeon]